MDKKQLCQLLNTLFLIGFVVTLILYMSLQDRTAFLIVGLTSLFIKLLEYFIRFFR